MTDPYAAPPPPEPGGTQPPLPAPPSPYAPYAPGGSVPPPYPMDGGAPYPGAGYPPPPSPYAGAGQPPYQQTPYQQHAPYQQTPYAQAPYSTYGAPQTPPGTDGISIAALVTGIACLGVVPLVLGIIGVRRTSRSGQSGKGLAITGIVLGGLQILFGVVVAVLAIVAGARGVFDDVTTWEPAERGTYYGDNPRLDALWDSCDEGDMQACDDLYQLSEVGSDYEWFGDSCGERTDGGEYCTRFDIVE